jgi:hypothetical protein
MNPTPLEDQVHDALHRKVDPIQHSPFTVTDVRQRARRIQRRRTIAAGAAVAAVLAIAAPVGLSMVDPAQRSEVPPATQPPVPQPTPTRASGPVLVDPRSAEAVDSVEVPLLDVDGPSLITPDRTLDLPMVFDTLTPYLDGWVGVTVSEGTGTIQFLDSDLAVEDGGSPTGGLVVSPDGQQIAWSEYTGSQWQVVLADPSGGAERVYTKFPPAPQEHFVVPVGFVAEDEVVVRAYDDTTATTTYTAGGDEPVEMPGLLQVEAVSPATGVVAGLSEATLDRACSAVVDGLARTGAPAWETCVHRLGPFSSTGRYVVGTDAMADGYGSPTLTVLDAATGEEVVDFEPVLPRRTVGGFWSQMTWIGDEALVVRMFSGDDYHMMRLGMDGSVQRIDIPSAGASGLKVAVPS